MRIKSVVALMCIGLILIMCGCRETREKLSGEESFYKDEVGGDREPEMEAEEKIKQEYVREEKEISENKAVLYIYDGLNGNKTFEIDEDEAVTKLRKMFGKEALTESSQGWRGTAKYYIDFGDGYAIGVYKNEPYCYIGTGVYEQDGYLMLSGDPGMSKGFDIQEDAHEYLLDVVDGLLKENR